MESAVFNILTNNKVYFCDEPGNTLTSSVRNMMNCFDVFIVEEGWLFYRLKIDCAMLGYLDEYEHLIAPSTESTGMICIAKIFECGKPVKHVESISWIEEDEFNRYYNKGKIRQLIAEICNLYQDNKYSDEVSSYKSNSNETNNETNTTDRNFEHGYSSDNL